MPKLNRPTAIAKLDLFRGHTLAYRNFRENIRKTRQLLEVGLSGIAGRIDELNEFIEKIDRAKVITGPPPREDDPRLREYVPDKEHEIVIFGQETVDKIKQGIEILRRENSTLRFHLYAILTVAIWGAFETYLFMLFEELYKRRPEMLKSTDDTLTFEEAIEHRDDIVNFVIERQLDKIGHFRLPEMLKHLRSKIKLDFSPQRQKQLAELYLVRNIVAHNMGIVQKSSLSKIPSSIKVTNGQIRVTKAFLEDMLVIVHKSGIDIEKHISGKFYKA